MSDSFGPLLEESGERVDVIHVCADVDAIHAGADEGLVFLFFQFVHAVVEGLLPFLVAGIDPGEFAGFGVFQGEQADVGDVVFHGVAQVNGDDVVAAVGHG